MKVLIADDDVISRRMLQGILTDWRYDVTAVANGEDAWRILQSDDTPQLAILDWVMPGLDGRQICEAVRERRGQRYIYVLLVTAKARKEDMVQGLEAGADDYLVKPYDPMELKARLMAGRRILDLQEELIAARESMRNQATRDFLTGSWNHRAIIEILEREFNRAQRESSHLGVIMADLDHFKHANDAHGHLAGDAVLREIADRLTAVVRPYDFVGRYGGEEFLIVSPGSDAENTARLAERLRQRIASAPVLHRGKAIPVTASLGVTAYQGSEQSRAHAVLHEADIAMYRAKNAGRNRVELSTQLVTANLAS